MNKIFKNEEWLRPAVQAVFVAISILLGVEFAGFVNSVVSSSMTAARPAGVEAYLPISSLMSLIYLVKSGSANTVHPAGLVIFAFSLASAFILRRGFCSWICPVGTASEWLYKTGEKIIGRNLVMPNWLDKALRSIKYLVLLFFLYHIIAMSVCELQYFIYGDYNRIADIKMYLFFKNIGIVGITVISSLAVLSVLFRNFWCRYLCPYGALLAFCSVLSPTAVYRDEKKCNACGACSRICPNLVKVDSFLNIRSEECTACYGCIKTCRTSALSMRIGIFKRVLPITAYAVIIAGGFLLVCQAAKLCGYWQSDTSFKTYSELYGRIGQIGHP